MKRHTFSPLGSLSPWTTNPKTVCVFLSILNLLVIFFLLCEIKFQFWFCYRKTCLCDEVSFFEWQDAEGNTALQIAQDLSVFQPPPSPFPLLLEYDKCWPPKMLGGLHFPGSYTRYNKIHSSIFKLLILVAILLGKFMVSFRLFRGLAMLSRPCGVLLASFWVNF